eukprot:scaffold543_cov119-Cylindrotheca_fusiformis.AAC.10
MTTRHECILSKPAKVRPRKHVAMDPTADNDSISHETYAALLGLDGGDLGHFFRRKNSLDSNSIASTHNSHLDIIRPPCIQREVQDSYDIGEGDFDYLATGAEMFSRHLPRRTLERAVILAASSEDFNRRSESMLNGAHRLFKPPRHDTADSDVSFGRTGAPYSQEDVNSFSSERDEKHLATSKTRGNAHARGKKEDMIEQVFNMVESVTCLSALSSIPTKTVGNGERDALDMIFERAEGTICSNHGTDNNGDQSSTQRDEQDEVISLHFVNARSKYRNAINRTCKTKPELDLIETNGETFGCNVVACHDDEGTKIPGCSDHPPPYANSDGSIFEDEEVMNRIKTRDALGHKRNQARDPPPSISPPGTSWKNPIVLTETMPPPPSPLFENPTSVSTLQYRFHHRHTPVAPSASFYPSQNAFIAFPSSGAPNGSSYHMHNPQNMHTIGAFPTSTCKESRGLVTKENLPNSTIMMPGLSFSVPNPESKGNEPKQKDVEPHLLPPEMAPELSTSLSFRWVPSGSTLYEGVVE